MAFVRLVDRLNKILLYMIAFALGVMLILIFYQVMVRFMFSDFLSAPWTEELSRYLMIWLIFLGAAVATRKAKLIAVESLVHSIPALLGKLLKIFAHLLSILFYVWIFIIGLKWAEFGLSETSPVLQISMIYVYSAMSVGAAFMILNTVTLFVETSINKRDIRDASIEDEGTDSLT